MASSIAENAAISVHMQQHSVGIDHSQKTNVYYHDGGAAAAAAAAAATGVINHWSGDSHQYQQQQHHRGSNTTDTACSSPLDTPLVKVMQQQQQQQQNGGSVAAGFNKDSANGMPAQPTPPQSASSHGFVQGGADAWRTYNHSYHQGMPMSAPYSTASFASPNSSGMSIGLESSSFDHNTAAADYYYNSSQHSNHHQQQQQNNQHPLHYHAAAAQNQQFQHPNSQQQQHSQHPQHHQHNQQNQQQQHHQFQHNGLHQDPGASQFDPASAAAAANGGSYMGDFGHNMYAGAPEIVSAPATVTHLPPIDSAGTLARHSSYFGMASVPAQGTFDSMSAAAAAAGTGHYLAAAAARGQQPYPSPMVVGRFNLGMPSAGTPGVIPTPPPASQMQGPPPLSAMGSGSMSVPSTPIRSIGMPRINGHAQSSTSQRKRYLCT
ncbi:hypothetical protein LPJ66_006964, partial [Kickxella alabastrina]